MLNLLSILCLSLTGLSIDTPNVTHNNDELIYRCSKDATQVNENSDNGEISPNLDLPIIPVYPPYPPIIPPIIPIPSIDVTYYSQKNFTKNFFINCEANVIQNSIGNCGYTAISTLLTYYDTYWSDVFIPEIYESSSTILTNNDDNVRNYYSPGIKNNTVFSYSTNSENLTKEQKSKEIHAFVDNAIDNKSTSFFGLLLDYAKNSGYIRDNDVIDFLGVNYDMMVKILKAYINGNSSISSTVTLVNKKLSDVDENVDALREEIIVQLKKGNPLIVGGNSHVCIAYEYDEVNDTIYGDLGWGKSYSHTNLDDFMKGGIQDYYYYKILDSLAHTHSLHYYNTTSSKYICSCELLSHTHGYHYGKYDADQHYRRCICMSYASLADHFSRILIGKVEKNILFVEDAVTQK